MKKIIFFLVMAIFSMPIFAAGYNMNFEANAGLSQCLFGGQVQKNMNIWEDSSKSMDYTSLGVAANAEIIFSEKFSLETGLGFRRQHINFIAADGNTYGNGKVNLRYSLIQVPVLAKYSFVLTKTTEVIDSLDVAGGLNASFIAGKSSYSDEITDFVGNFITPQFNFGLSMKVTYTHKVGRGRFFAGLRADTNFLPQGYKISGKNMEFGNVLTVSPCFGYSFVIKKDQGISKITEKNMRIQDLDVE